MISFSYNTASFTSFLYSLSAHVGAAVKDQVLYLPERVGKGFIRCMDLPNGLGLMLLDFTLHDTVYFKRAQNDEEFYVFTCESFAEQPGLQHTLDGEATGNTGRRSSMYLVSFLSDYEMFAQPGTSLRGIRVLLSREWLARYFKLANTDDVLLRYLALKTRSIQVKETDHESMMLMNELLDAALTDTKPALFYESRLLLVMENFFTWLYAQQHTHTFDTRLSREDVERVMAVEKDLVKDLRFAPYIDDLARKYGMSSARLKKLFKDIFGLPVYQYFQKARMQKARELLLGQQHFSVTDIGIELGYENMSHFSAAFKKQFGMLPGDLILRKTLR